jgi:hypothetical protein
MREERGLVLLFDVRPVSERDRGELEAERYRVRTRSVRLVPPVDWRMDPFDNRSWRFWFHTLEFLDVPLRIYEQDEDLDALSKARDLVLDWVARNPIGGERTGDFAWYDMSAGLRASFLGYCWRECRRHSLLDGTQREQLADSLREHGDWLSRNENYTAETNHGLYQDAGLFLMGTYAVDMAEAAEWRALAEDRFLTTLSKHVEFDEGVHKEHSPGYQMHIRRLVKRLHEGVGIGDERLDALLERLDASAGWLVLPDGMTLPFGDTNMVKAPAFARESSDRQGLRAFLETGYAVVRQDGSYLAMTCCYHGRAHKHADELSWCLYERGYLIVGEASRYGYRDERDPARVYARSSHGHNVLIVDDQSFPWLDEQPYGSGLLASGKGHGWYALLGHNPLLRGVEHRRLLLYRPGVLVVVVDRVDSDDEHEIVRRVHFGPELSVTEATGEIIAEADGVQLAGLIDGSEAPIEIGVARGVEKPRMDGWTFPDDGVKVPSYAVTLRTRIASGVLVHGVVLAPAAIRQLGARMDGDGFAVSLEGTDLTGEIRVIASGRELDLVASP